MKTIFNDPLLLAGRILTYIMQAFMLIAALAMTIAVPGLMIFHPEIQAEIIAENGAAISALPTFTITALILLALIAVSAGFIFFRKLRQIINSVGEGEPFAPENADRLTMMAWIALGIYGLSAVMVALALTISDWIDQVGDGEGLSMSLGIDLSSILMIVILFILARVFRHGSQMRDDLEGTV